MAVAVALVGEDKLSGPTKNATAAIAGLEKQAEHTGGILGSLTGALGKVGLAGLGIQTAISAISGIGGLLTKPIQMASDLAESQSKVDVVFGDSATTITDWAATAAQNLGQSKAQALAAAGGFGNLFVTMGLGQQKAAGLSTKIVTLASDLASFNNIDPSEAAEKLRAGLVGEAEPLRALGININEAAVQEEALRLGLAKSKTEISDAAKIQARYSLILKQSKTAQGDFAKTSTGMANATRIINASLADLQTEIGNRLLPVIAPLVSQVAQALPRAMDALRPILDRAGAAFKTIADTVGRFVATLREKGIVAALRELGAAIGPALVAGLRSLTSFAGTVVGWLREQIGKIDWKAVWSTVTGFAAGLLAGVGSIVATVVDWLKAQWAQINWASVWATVTNIGAGLLASLGSIVGSVVGWLQDQWRRIEWGPIWQSITGLVVGLADGLGAIWSSVTTWLAAQWALVPWDDIWKAVQGHGAALVKSLPSITDDVQTWLVNQITAIDWPSVWTAAQTGTRLTQSLVQLLRGLDGHPIGAAVADLLIRAFRAGIALALAPGGALEGIGPETVVALAREMVQFPFLAMNTLATVFKQALEGAFSRTVNELLNLGPFTRDLKAKITAAIAGIFPLTIGPLTIGLGGVSVNLTGVANAVGAAAGAVGGAIGGGGGGETGGGERVSAFQHGGAFRVGGAGGVDSQMVRFRATPGEVVAVGHARAGGGGGGPVVVNQTFNVANRADAEYLADVLPDALARALEKARSQQGLPVVSGLTRYA